jgi:DNA-binding CsgD family transcriptional regulator
LAVVHAERRSAGVATVTAFNVAGETYSAIISSRVDELAEAHALTHREREILQFLLLGRSSEEIASALGITPRTVKYHQQNLLRKLGADSRVDLTRLLL